MTRRKTFAEEYADNWRERVLFMQKFQKGMRETMHKIRRHWKLYDTAKGG